MNEKHVGESNLKSLIAWIRKQLSKKLESVTSNDHTINVEDKRKVSVRISRAEGNRIQVKTGYGEDGIYVPEAPVPNKLIIGDQEFDGSKEITVDVDGLVDEVIATNQEVDEMIDDVFGDTEAAQTSAG